MAAAGTQRSTEEKPLAWTHPSVRSLISVSTLDPIGEIVSRARKTVFEAIQSGWSGPPYDPFVLAEFLRIEVEPRQDVVDARTVPLAGGRFRIEFNPNRSAARINFSIAHEVAHTMFSDCADQIRNRVGTAAMKRDDWQLEMLCNIAAAEFLMPIGSFKFDEGLPLSIDSIIELRRRFSVSSEAVLLRVAKLTSRSCFVFAAHRDESKVQATYRLDYAVHSRKVSVSDECTFRLPSNSLLAECTAIGFTAKSNDHVGSHNDEWRVECVGVPPYPGHLYPRVLGLVMTERIQPAENPSIKYLRGDATNMRGEGAKLLVQVVNDKAISWGRGFSLAVKKKWPKAQTEFTRWALSSRSEFQLGHSHFHSLDENTILVSLVAQHGYGPSLFPRIDYLAMHQCLTEVANRASQTGASVHMPRIGCGEARGDWNIVSEIIDETLLTRGITVMVYDPPNKVTMASEPPLFSLS